jgi:hypothetical protein
VQLKGKVKLLLRPFLSIPVELRGHELRKHLYL